MQQADGACLDGAAFAHRAQLLGRLGLHVDLAGLQPQQRGDRVAATIDRSAKWAAQTPQMFRLGQLREALATAGAAVTDEASAVEALGLAPRLVPGDQENFKLTFPGDFALAARLLATREVTA